MVEVQVKAGMPQNIKLSGIIGDRIDLFCRERALSEESWRTACRESVDAFINKVDDLSGLHGLWQGEFWGKWILSAIDVCEYTQDEKLKAFIAESIKEIISANPGILQSELYRKYDPVLKDSISELLYFAAKDGRIRREKSGRSYQLFWGK